MISLGGRLRDFTLYLATTCRLPLRAGALYNSMVNAPLAPSRALAALLCWRAMLKGE